MTAKRNVAIVGLGKMGISHLAIANATPALSVTTICDSSSMLGQLVERHCRLRYVADYDDALATPGLDGVVIATPTRSHEDMIRKALARGLHVFCEKPLTLSAAASAEFAAEAVERRLACQVGYHNRFVGTFGETKRLLAAGAIGRIRHVQAEAYGPVVLRPASMTWRSKSSEGGGCLNDYAAHPINLMNWFVGRPAHCSGAQLTKQYSVDVEDAVYAELLFDHGVSGQVSVNWSDETVRKMTTRISVWGDKGKIVVDRQELQIYISGTTAMAGYRTGWNVKNITELTSHPTFYLRGEEYSSQLESFGAAMASGDPECTNDFASAADTDYTLGLIRSASLAEKTVTSEAALRTDRISDRSSGLGRVFGRNWRTKAT